MTATRQLFTPITFRDLTLANRVVVAPMCQYSAHEGCMRDWHAVHLGGLALSGAGLLMVEATAVLPEGRITPQCVGLWDDASERAMARVLAMVRGVSATPLGLQIGHAGRKASSYRPWQGRTALPADDGAWQTLAPSALAFGADWPLPLELDRAGMTRIRDAFVATTKRAVALGFDLLELHCAHGYLLSTFLSPLSNRRDDEYGGNRENRMRFPLEVARAVREAWPAERPLSAKINGSDWVPGGTDADDAVAFARELGHAGIDLVMASSGGVTADARIPSEAGYQVPFAARIRAESGVASAAVGLIDDPLFAESIVAEGRADLVALARGMLYDPRWPLHAAQALGVDVPWPPQYQRASPGAWPLAAVAAARRSPAA